MIPLITGEKGTVSESFR